MVENIFWKFWENDRNATNLMEGKKWEACM